MQKLISISCLGFKIIIPLTINLSAELNFSPAQNLSPEMSDATGTNELRRGSKGQRVKGSKVFESIAVTADKSLAQNWSS